MTQTQVGSELIKRVHTERMRTKITYFQRIISKTKQKSVKYDFIYTPMALSCLIGFQQTSDKGFSTSL